MSQEVASGAPIQVLAVGRFDVKPAIEQMEVIMPQEVPRTLQLYLDGKITQWFARRDQGGVVFLMSVSSIDEARSLLEALPLGVAGLMKFDLIPIGVLAPLRFLLDPQLDWKKLLQRP